MNKRPFSGRPEFSGNLAAKMNNTIADLNHYATRFLTTKGFRSVTGSGIEDAQNLIAQGVALPVQIYVIIEQYEKVLVCEPDKANELFYETWDFLHKFDKQLRNHV